ncbi:pentapeptide repeat-containing protein [Thalassococcus sp. BH17M4-6]|uniref:pentapeptide repeat-containing protein n=1 Tax=Thalassococcus sp. BH17M4-6 TaxID=3413148 RepID=UPI003BE47738
MSFCSSPVFRGANPLVFLILTALPTLAPAQSAPVDMSGQPVVGENYAGQDLSGANFQNAQIEGSNFSGANLTGADFSGATITDQDGTPTLFTGADLSNTAFTAAAMSAADIQYATLSCTDFSDAQMPGVVAGAALVGLDASCAPVFTGASVNCNIAEFPDQLDLAGATLPASCPGATTQSAEAVATDPAWACAGTVPTGYDAWTYASASTGQDGAACTSEAPCASVAAALAACPSGGSCAALVYYDAYEVTETINLGPDQAILGACLPSSTPTSADASSYYSVISMTGTDSGGAPVVAADGTPNAALSFLHLSGNSPAAASAPSVTLQATNGAFLTLTSVTVVAGNGSDGDAGADASTTYSTPGSAGGTAGASNSQCTATGGSGGNGKGGTAELNMDGLKINPSCSSSCSGNCDGTNGAPGGAGASTSYSNGGGAGSTVCGSNITYNCDNGKGHGGQGGQTGPCGPGGAASTVVTGTFGADGWQPVKGGDGTAGGIGGAGGGGGGGGMCAANSTPISENVHTGQNGGGGGAGGCGGDFGRGGQQGGASIAVVLDNATLTVTDTVITGGRGGPGGKGGAALQGGQGSNGHAGFTKSGGYSDGGPGGNGAPGGSGGGGAGGNGGPALGVALVNGGTVSGTPVYFTGYASNGGDAGGTAATANNSCTPNPGAQGVPGRVANTETYQY